MFGEHVKQSTRGGKESGKFSPLKTISPSPPHIKDYFRRKLMDPILQWNLKGLYILHSLAET